MTMLYAMLRSGIGCYNTSTQRLTWWWLLRLGSTVQVGSNQRTAEPNETLLGTNAIGCNVLAQLILHFYYRRACLKQCILASMIIAKGRFRLRL